MKALRWILFSLLAFGVGTGVALAVHPPTVGIPTASASGLSADLSRIEELAGQGNCNGVLGRVNGANAKIDKIPSTVPTATIDKLTSALQTVKGEALRTCQQVNADKQAAEPTPTPTPAPTPTPEPTPEEEPITPTEEAPTTPGPGEGTSPDSSGGTGLPGGTDDGGATQGDGDTSGGIGIPNEEAIRQQVDKERRKWEKQADRIRKALER